MRNTVNVLWTGGLDSSYRVCELSRLPIVIRPYYIWDSGRHSIPQELRAMERITTDIKKHPATRAELLPIKIIHDTDIKADSAITQAWKVLNERYALGSQYDLLARFADQYGLKLEVGLENSPRSKATNTIKSVTAIQLTTVNIRGGKYEVYNIIPEKSSPEGALIFKNLLLPATLWHKSKLEEVEGYKALDFEHIITKTWFCHHPVLGMPCGQCNPCKDSLNEGLAFRVPLIGRILGATRRYTLGIVHRIGRLFNR